MANSYTQKASHLYQQVSRLYECHNYRHAVAILKTDFPHEFIDICEVLLRTDLLETRSSGHGISDTKCQTLIHNWLQPKGWAKERVAEQVVFEYEVLSENTYSLDWVKNRVVFDVGWNTKRSCKTHLSSLQPFFTHNKISVVVVASNNTRLVDCIETYGKGSWKDEVGVGAFAAVRHLRARSIPLLVIN
jgi:hypothetical protein